MDQVRPYPTDFVPTTPAFIARSVDRYGDRDCVIEAERTWTYRDVAGDSSLMARQLLGLGIGKGARVAMLMPQGATWINTFLAITRIGAVAVPLSTLATPVEVQRMLRHADVDTLVTAGSLIGQDSAFLERVAPGLGSISSSRRQPDLPYLRRVLLTTGSSLEVRAGDVVGDPGGVDDECLAAIENAVHPADLMVLVHTSGTTAEPKAVMHTHGAQLRHAAQLAALNGISSDDRLFAAMPFFWIGGLTRTLLPAIHQGAALICQERFDARSALELIVRARATALVSWVTVRQRLLAEASVSDLDLSGIPFLTSRDAPAYNSLGMTETSGPHSGLPVAERGGALGPEHAGSWGRALEGMQHRIVDPETGEPLPDGEAGEICVRGYNVMAGLYKREREEVFDADGWYHTGDRGYVRDGHLYFTGRGSDMIKTAGANVSPREVESVLEQSPEVEAAFVFGVADDERGQVPVAAVVRAPRSHLTASELLIAAKASLASYKAPRGIVFVDKADLPVLSSSKVDRAELGRRVAQRWAAGGGRADS